MSSFKTLREEFEYLYGRLESNLVSFKRDYKDANNFYRLVQIGTRLEDKELLVKECWDVVNNPEYKGTPDLGGALCVVGYNDKNLDLDRFQILIRNYLKTADEENPHNVRWAISLQYLCGILTHEEEYFINCFVYNFKKFNTLILTKQLLSGEKLARIYLDTDRKFMARTILEHCIELYKQGLKHNLNKTVGKNGTYIHFACTELGLLSDIASQLVLFLNNLELYHRDRKKFEAIFSLKRFGYQKRCFELEKEIQELKNELDKRRT